MGRRCVLRFCLTDFSFLLSSFIFLRLFTQTPADGCYADEVKGANAPEPSMGPAARPSVGTQQAFNLASPRPGGGPP
jgi:hypothetical protein